MLFRSSQEDRGRKASAPEMGGYTAKRGMYDLLKQAHVYVCGKLLMDMRNKLGLDRLKKKGPVTADLGLAGGPKSPFGTNFG
jgi:hypothetical protein